MAQRLEPAFVINKKLRHSLGRLQVASARVVYIEQPAVNGRLLPLEADRNQPEAAVHDEFCHPKTDTTDIYETQGDSYCFERLPAIRNLRVF